MNNEPNLNNPVPAPQPTNEAPETKRCPVCGKEVPAQAAFCGECGYNFAAGTSPYTVPPQASVMAEDTAPLKVSDYLIMSLLNCIPIAGIVVMLIWAFSSGVNVNRRNFSRAYLIMAAVGVVLYFILLIAMVGFMAATMEVMDEAIFSTILPFIFR
ncbi:MAG: zinc ribbon domain-containing protein [Clostridia bacterium]|nr:zinc ribbon domain-containing protein [Clostridia bacterium]